MAIRAWYMSNNQRHLELDTLWVTENDHRKNASLGGNWGYYVSMDEIYRHYVQEYQQRLERKLECYLKAAHPSAEAEIGHGCCQMFPASTSVVRMADDGETARGIWYSVGHLTELNEDGKTATPLWINGRIFADFIKENGSWKIWHLVYANDMSYRAGSRYNDMPTYLAPEDDPVCQMFGQPTIPMLTHDTTYNWADGYPHFPEPYATYSPEIGYGPEGHPLYHGGEGK